GEGQQNPPVHQGEGHEDQGGEGEAVQGNRNERRRGPGDEDGRERDRYHGEGDRRIGTAGHVFRTSARLSNGCGATTAAVASPGAAAAADTCREDRGPGVVERSRGPRRQSPPAR